jgi:hypothetical protein
MSSLAGGEREREPTREERLSCKPMKAYGGAE